MSKPEPSVSTKARRIAGVLQRHVSMDDCALLDIGTGSGETAAGLQSLGATVTAIDQQANDFTAAWLDVQLVAGTTLPFGDGSFDAVLYSHVIEHVGTRDDQRHHLSEIRRVLRAGGVLYLAMPNRWSVMEPHYKLPFLSWLPAGMASAYVRTIRRAPAYDCLPLSRRSLRRLFSECGFHGEEVTGEILDAVLDERLRNPAFRSVARFVARRRWLSMPLIPVLVFVARPVSS